MPTNKQQLKDAIVEIWKTIEIDTVNSLIESFLYRIQMRYDVAGKSISHHLSSNKHSIPEEDKATDFPYLLTPNDNNLIYIYQQNLKNPRKWKDNSGKLSNDFQIEPSSLRIKCNELEGKIRDYKNHEDLFEEIPQDISLILQSINPFETAQNQSKDSSSDEESYD